MGWGALTRGKMNNQEQRNTIHQSRQGAQEPPNLKSLISDLQEDLANHLTGVLRREKANTKPGPLMDVEAVAQRLNVSKRTVETLIAEGQLNPIWVRGQRRFTRKAIDAYIRNNVGHSTRGGRT